MHYGCMSPVIGCSAIMHTHAFMTVQNWKHLTLVAVNNIRAVLIREVLHAMCSKCILIKTA